MTIHNNTRLLTPTLVRRLLAAVAAVAAITGTLPLAHAGLMGSDYDITVRGFVLENGNESVEEYSATNVPFELVTHFSVPNTLSPTPAPPFTSTAARVNRVVVASGVEFDNPPSGTNIEFWVKGPLGDPNRVFVNDLDPSKLVEVELTLLWDNLDFGQQIEINDANLVLGVLADAVSVETTGTGFGGDANHPASPLHVLIKYDPDDVNTLGFMKIQFDYSTTDVVVPEPATLALFGLAGLGLLGLFRSRRQ